MTQDTARPLIAEIRNLEVEYRNDQSTIHALQRASIEIGKGETVGIVGESGSGKSTIARALLGLLDLRSARITGGNIILGGKDVTHLSVKEWESNRGNPAAMVFQDPLTFLNPVMTVGRQIEESVQFHDPQARPAERVAELIDMVKLPRSVVKSYPDELSGGMRQRALLAIALGCRPQLLVADEPTTALDVTTQAEIIELLRQLQHKTGMAMLLISHDLGLVASVCEKIYVMYTGRTIEWGPAEDIFNDPLHPYTSGLLAAAESRRNQEGLFVTIGGEVPDLRFDVPSCSFEPRCSCAIPQCSAMPDATWVDSLGKHMVRCHAVEVPAPLKKAAT